MISFLMSHESEKQAWLLENFEHMFLGNDQDFVYMALQDMLNHISQINYFKELEGGEKYVTMIINNIVNEPRYWKDPSLRPIFDLCMKIIPQFVTKLPIDLVPTVYDLCLASVNKPEIGHFTTLSEVLEKTILNGSDYSDERKQAITNCLVIKLIPLINDQTSKPAVRYLSLKLIKAINATFPKCLTPQMKNDIEKISKMEIPPPSIEESPANTNQPELEKEEIIRYSVFRILIRHKQLEKTEIEKKVQEMVSSHFNVTADMIDKALNKIENKHAVKKTENGKEIWEYLP